MYINRIRIVIESQKLAKEKHLRAKGTRAELIKRLAAMDSSADVSFCGDSIPSDEQASVKEISLQRLFL